MPRYSNRTQDGNEPVDTGTPTGSSKTSSEMVTDLKLTEDTAADQGTKQEVVMPKTTIFSSTNFQYPGRAIRLSQADYEKIKNDGLYDTRFVDKSSVRPAGANPSLPFIYTGPQLIDESSGTAKIYGPGYASNGDDINAEFFGVTSPAERALLISTATRLGLFFNNKPSPAMIAGTGLSSTDANAVQGLLDYSTKNGYTWRTVASRLSSGMLSAPTVSGGSGTSYSVVATEDAMAAAKDAWFSVLKRPPTPGEMKQAALTIQQNERARASSKNMDPVSLKTAATLQAQQRSPGEFAAVSAGNAMTRMFSLFGGA